MPERTVTIGSSVGLHARPATLFVQEAAQQTVKVTIGRPGEEPVDARGILGVLGLGIKGGEEIVLAAEGDGADAALDTLASLLARDLDAE